MSGTDDPGHPEEQVGSVSEEAARLFGALSGWAHDQDAHHEHLAAGGAACTWCPVCRTVHAVRRTSPEVRAHLAAAASSLLQAAAGLLATAVPPEARADGRGHGVERIDLDADDEHHQGADRAPSEEDEQ